MTMKVFLLTLLVAFAAAAPIEDSGDAVEVIVNGVPEGQALEIGDIVDIKLKEHVDGTLAASSDLLHPFTAVGIAEAALAEEPAQVIDEINPIDVMPVMVEESVVPAPVVLPEPVILPEPVVLPELVVPVVVPTPVVLPEPANPIVVPSPVVLPEPANPIVVPSPVYMPESADPIVVPSPVVLPEAADPIVVPSPVVLPEPANPIVVPSPVVLPEPANPIVVPSPVVLPEPVFPGVIPSPVVLPEIVNPEVIPSPVVIPELVVPEVVAEIPEPVPQIPTGEVYNDGLVQVTVNAPEDTGVFATLQSWVSMVLNYFNNGVQTTQQIL